MEVAAELHDMIQEDLRKIYPDLMKDVTIRLIELQVPCIPASSPASCEKPTFPPHLGDKVQAQAWQVLMSTA